MKVMGDALSVSSFGLVGDILGVVLQNTQKEERKKKNDEKKEKGDEESEKIVQIA